MSHVYPQLEVSSLLLGCTANLQLLGYTVIVAAYKQKVALRQGLPAGLLLGFCPPWLFWVVQRWASHHSSHVALFPWHGSPLGKVAHALCSVSAAFTVVPPVSQSRTM